MSEDEDLKKYRDSLMQFDHEASLNFDKTVMSLSGGALGLTITFIKDIVPNPVDGTKIFLLVSWIALATSLTFILFSYLTSMMSLRKAMEQVDTKKIYEERVGGNATVITEWLRNLSSLGFLVGLISFIVYVLLNY